MQSFIVKIWQIANDVRGSVDGWDLSNTFWAHFSTVLSAKIFPAYIEAGDDSICYAKLMIDSVITDDIKDDAIKTKGYFIYPSQLFSAT